MISDRTTSHHPLYVSQGNKKVPMTSSRKNNASSPPPRNPIINYEELHADVKQVSSSAFASSNGHKHPSTNLVAQKLDHGRSHSERNNNVRRSYSFGIPTGSSSSNTINNNDFMVTDLPPSYEAAISQNNNNNFMESKRKEYLIQKLNHLKKQNSTSLEHFQIVRDDVRQSKVVMEKQILQAYGAMKLKLESLLQESLNSLADMEAEMTEPLDVKIEQLKRNMRAIDMTENTLARQPFSETVKEKVDACLKANVPPFTSDIDIYKLTDINNYPMIRVSHSFLGADASKKSPIPTSSRLSMDIDPSNREKRNNLHNDYDTYHNRVITDDCKNDSLNISECTDYDYAPRTYPERNNTNYMSSSKRTIDTERVPKEHPLTPSDSVIGSYQQLEDLYSQTKNCAVFKGTNF
ncbi:hypothetical protein FDP41_012727 [Naegleria fowleri]|uniref:Uncharacterized protein n=1 Tax=Naegleria fowleri TaxID=5763 RepID=A0A6A5C6L2_NAEFO|nr:uncharacterized protein FDP41_012727 [Naegleria fowleri]KAF0980939.1 hypothetical protein FDP41_012727 [Naegleria fowleri]CAG4714773.1 unnamed protein product [Naegleria fowleri]